MKLWLPAHATPRARPAVLRDRVVRAARVGRLSTAKATHSCPLFRPISGVHCRSARESHGRTPCSWRLTRWLARSMPQHVPGSASQPFWWRGRRVAGACCWSVRAMGRSGRATVRPPSSSLVGRQFGCQASTKSHLSSRRTTARNDPRQGAKVHQLASEMPLSCLM